MPTLIATASKRRLRQSGKNETTEARVCSCEVSGSEQSSTQRAFVERFKERWHWGTANLNRISDTAISTIDHQHLSVPLKTQRMPIPQNFLVHFDSFMRLS